jgi:hypothetical protein
MKKATATSHGSSRLAASEGLDKDGEEINELGWFIGKELRKASLP